MTQPDLNLLITLDVLLAEGSVARAAQRLRLSPSAMSRALARLRQTTGDPLLVRAGRGLVPTPRAMALRAQVARLVEDAGTVLRPVEALDLARLERTFTLRNREGFVETFGAELIGRTSRQAPGVTLRFVPKPDKDSTPLRDGSIDLETGVIGTDTGPEVRAHALFHDHFVGVVGQGHPMSGCAVSPADYANGGHILVSRRGSGRSAIDDALQTVGLKRRIVTVVSSFSEAAALARATDLIASLPERYTKTMRDGLVPFALPLALPDLVVSLLWHPRMDADPAHRWLRGLVRDVCSR